MRGLRMIFFSMVLYSVGLLAALIVTSPYWLFRMAWSGRYRDGLMQRLGAVPRAVRELAGSRRTIWVHAVSVGEVTAAAPLLELLSRAHPDSAVALTTTTRTGHALAQERFRGNASVGVLYSPLDFAWSVRRYLKFLQPAVLVLMESELWPRMLTEADRARVPVIVVNGRISDRSLPRYRALRRLWRPFLRKLTMVLAQSEQDRERFIAIGVPPDRVRTGGNLKFDVRPPAEMEIVRLLRENLPHDAAVLVAGSTLEGEEELLLAAYRQLAADVPNLCLILAPRHPQRFDRVAQWIANDGLSLMRRSVWASRPEPISAGAVFLLDSIGELSSVYALATVAFLGGSLVPAGGHNPLEPAQFSVPIVMGPSIENFRGIVAELLAQDAMRVTPPEKLADTLHALLIDPQAKGMGLRAQTVFAANAGAAQRAAAAILQIVERETARGAAR